MKQKYYILDHSFNLNITGVETRQIIDLFDKKDKKQSTIDDYNENRKGYLSENKPDLFNFLLDPKSKLTDLLSSYLLRLDGIFVSQKFKNLLEKAKTENLKFFKTILYQNNNKIDNYFFMNILDSQSIDFEKSVFVKDKKMKLLRGGGEQIQITGLDDLKTKLSELVLIPSSLTILPKTIFLTEDLDIILFPNSTSLFCSEQLKTKIEKENLSGIEFKSSDIEFYTTA